MTSKMQQVSDPLTEPHPARPVQPAPSSATQDSLERPGIASTLAEFLRESPNPARDVAIEVFRRQLARLQTHVRERFEVGHLGGLAAARLLAGLMDEFLSALFDHERRVTETPVTYRALVLFGRNIRSWTFGRAIGSEHQLEMCEQCPVSGKATRVEHRCPNGYIAGSFGKTILGRPRCVTDFQTKIPEKI